MSFDKLSDDLLLDIAEWVGTDAFHPSLVNTNIVRGTRFLGPLALCSRRLNTIVSPLLYRTFTQTNTKALPAFLRLVLEKPQIGEEVKKFVGTEIASNSEDLDEKLDMSRFSSLDFDQCRIAMHSFRGLLVGKSWWMTAVEQGNWYAIVALLLLYLPNLEEIEIARFYGRVQESEYFIQTFNYVARNQSFNGSRYSLKHLKTISVVYSNGVHKYDANLNIFLSFFAPPSVSKIVISGFMWIDLLSEPHSYQVQDLRLKDCCVGGDTMIEFLRCFASIRKFHYVHGYGAFRVHLFLPEKIREALAHLHHCLEELTLLGYKRTRWSDDPKIRQGIGSLTQFKKLRRIKICVEDLVGSDTRNEDDGDGSSHLVEKLRLADIFPASLQALVLCKAKSNILVPLYEFLNNKEGFPLLMNIVVQIRELRDDYQEEAEENLKSKYKDAGIELHLRHSGDPTNGVAAFAEDN